MKIKALSRNKAKTQIEKMRRILRKIWYPKRIRLEAINNMTKKIKGTYHPEILKILKGTELSEIQYPTNNFLQKANDHFQKAEENRQEALASILNLIFISRDISQLKNLQTSFPELINFDLMKKAFKERKDLINFIEFGLHTFTMKVKKTITQNEFLRKLGIIERAEILGKKMKFSDQTNLYLRLKRLLSPKSMGDLFKVILAYKFKKNNYLGFE